MSSYSFIGFLLCVGGHVLVLYFLFFVVLGSHIHFFVLWEVSLCRPFGEILSLTNKLNNNTDIYYELLL